MKVFILNHTFSTLVAYTSLHKESDYFWNILYIKLHFSFEIAFVNIFTVKHGICHFTVLPKMHTEESLWNPRLQSKGK